MAGGSADAAAALRLAAARRRRRRRRAARAPRRRPRRRRPRAGPARPVAGHRARASASSALPPSPPLGVLVLPIDAALSTAAVYREADRLGLPRALARRAARRRRARRVAATGDLPPALLVNDLEAAARSLRPSRRSRPLASRVARSRRRPSRSSPAPARRSSASSPSGAGRARARRAADRAAPARSPARRSRREARLPLVAAAAVVAFARRPPAQARATQSSRSADRCSSPGSAVYGTGARRAAQPREAARGRRRGARARGPTCSSASSPSSRPAPSSGSSRRARSAIIVGGVVAGQGEIDVVALIAHRLGVRGRRRHDELLPRPPPRPRRSSCATARASRSPRSACSRSSGFFDRHGGKAIFLGRFVGLVRADRAVPRRLERDAASGASCPTTSSAPGCGARRSRCSATSSGAASTASPSYASRARCALGSVIVLVAGGVVAYRCA